MGRHSGCNKGRPDRVWTEALGEAFVALVAETGNARAAARQLGHPHLFNNRMRRDPAFKARVRAAAGRADARLRTPPTPLLWAAPRKALPTDAEALGGYLRPGRKRAAGGPEPVIRRTSNGRTQVTMARAGHWTSEIEADFLDRVAASGNFDASARAVGFQPASVHYRVRKWPAFRAAVDEALEAAGIRLEYALVAHADALLRGGPGTPAEAEGEAAKGAADGSEHSAGAESEAPFDPERAMRILGFLDRRRAGRTARGPRGGAPERGFAEAVESILRKVEAIERHEKSSRQSGTLPRAEGEASGGEPE